MRAPPNNKDFRLSSVLLILPPFALHAAAAVATLISELCRIWVVLRRPAILPPVEAGLLVIAAMVEEVTREEVPDIRAPVDHLEAVVEAGLSPPLIIMICIGSKLLMQAAAAAAGLASLELGQMVLVVPPGQLLLTRVSRTLTGAAAAAAAQVAHPGRVLAATVKHSMAHRPGPLLVATVALVGHSEAAAVAADLLSF